MPIIKSAKKRVKLAAKANLRNTQTKRAMRDAIKAFTKAVATKPAEIEKTQRDAVKAIDQAVKKAVIHKNKGARIKARLSAQAKAAGAKISKAPAKKPVATKKPAVKKVAKTTKSKK